MTETELRVVGRYELHAEIASGGMAVVHLGRLLGAGGFAKSVAIKRLHSHLARDPEFVSALLQEARIAERVRHPNVVATLDVVAEENELLLVMEYVHGDTLARLLKASGEAKRAWPPEIAARILYDVLLGLHAAHTATDATGAPLVIVHRDVSPQNVMVGIDGVARLVDFGVAKALGSVGTTREGHLKGKIAYMAPELLRYEPATPQTDVWAAAVVLWETRCARRLFRGDSEVEVWTRVLQGEIPEPASIAGDATAIDEVIMRGLARDPLERYPSALAMADDLERAIRLASPAEVATWIAPLMSTSIAERGALLKKIEASDPTPLSRTGPAPSLDEGRSGRRLLWLPLLLVPVLTGAAWLAFGPKPPAVPTPPPPVTSTPSASSPAPLPLSADAAPSGDDAGRTEEAGAHDAAAPHDAAPPKGVRDRGQHRDPNRGRMDAGAATITPPPKAPDCDPPYYVDAEGRKRFKLECVK